MTKVYILTGPVRSGKTSSLLQWSTQNSCGGVLSPDGEKGRVFLDLISGREEQMEAFEPSEDDFLVGKFRFRRKAFQFATDSLTKAMESDNRFIVVDEVGPLELNGKGLDAGVRILLSSSKTHDLLLVVRGGLVDDVVLHYSLKNYRVIQKEELPGH